MYSNNTCNCVLFFDLFCSLSGALIIIPGAASKLTHLKVDRKEGHLKTLEKNNQSSHVLNRIFVLFKSHINVHNLSTSENDRLTDG